jgi:hypothetical protein
VIVWARSIGDMGRKTTGNDLDNAWVRFEHLRVPQTALLNRYGSIVDDQYVPTMKGIRTMDMIGQRLFTGRGLHSFPFPLNLSLLCPSPLN